MKALISVYDKTGIVEFASKLEGLGTHILSTGGTHQTLLDNGIPVTQVSEYTGSPEILDGRVKTLHPIIHGGILAKRDNPNHIAELQQMRVDTIDLVIVNLYPFAATISRPNVTMEEALENIDIGGPTMIRSAAKNLGWVCVLVDPADYNVVSSEINETGALSFSTRKKLASKAFGHTAEYDTIIHNYVEDESMPTVLNLSYNKHSELRYGENPHQFASSYKIVGNSSTLLILS